MKRILTLCLALFSFVWADAQDLSVISITSPISGCALSTTENVTIRVFNFGPNLPSGTTFNVSYTINSGSPVTELITLSSTLLINSTLTYTFTTPADLSVAGSYTFDATVALTGDINPTNDAFTGYTVTSTASSVGGTVTGPSNVCRTSNSGVVMLTGQVGNVNRWEYSTDGGSTWFTLSNTTNSQAFNNLTTQTLYRAVVQNGGCTPAISTIHTINIDNASVGGTVSPASVSVCATGNSGTLTLSGRVGNVIQWEFSTDGGITWNVIANTAGTQTYSNIPSTRRYRALVQNGTCTAVYSSVSIITVSPTPVGGSISGSSTTVCSGTNSGTITLSGQVGSIVRWEVSSNSGISWSSITNTTVNQTYSNITSTRWFRVRVQSGACGLVYSDTAIITVSPVSAGGAISPVTTSVCTGNNTGILVLSGNNGIIQFWESSTDGGLTWSTIVNTNDSFSFSNLTTTTLYRAFSANGVCPGAYSIPATVAVSNLSVGGTVSGGVTVCSGSNSGSLTLSGQVGSVVNWESSPDGLSWTSIANTTTTQTYSNLTDTTYYRAIVANGVCFSDTSTIDTVFVDPVSVGGSVSPATQVVCSGSNSGVLSLTGNIGNVIRWELSTDNGSTWIAISNTATTLTYNNINTATLYRAVIQGGVCSSAYSSITSLTIDQPSQGGTLYGSATVCAGSNGGTLTLIGQSGGIQGWESSSDGGITWSSIANTSAAYNYLNLADTTLYRTIVANGVCPADTSTLVQITVDNPSVGGIVSVSDTVCSGANSGVLTLSGQTGIVDGWEYSVDGGTTWIYISNLTTSQGYTNLTQTTSYRARVKNGVCTPVTSVDATITVDAPSIGGSISGATSVCITGNSGVLNLVGTSGNIATWEESSDNGLTWTANGNTTTSQSYTNLTDTTWYRAIVQSTVCGSDTSDIGIMTVDPATVGGIAGPPDTLCGGVGSGVIHVTAFVGDIIRWESSTDGFNWIAYANTSDSLQYANLVQTSYFRALVQSGACSPAVYSSIDTIVVTSQADAGTISGATSVCEGVGAGTLIVSGFNGNVSSWQSSLDGGLTWSTIANATNTLSWNAPTDTVWYRAIISNGPCGTDTSAPAMIATLPSPVVSFTADTVCLGVATAFNNTTTLSAGFIQFRNWDFGDNTTAVVQSPNHLYAASGTYSVVLTMISNSGCSTSDTQTVVVNALPASNLTVSGNATLCAGDSVNLIVPVSSTTTYLWNTGATANNIYVQSAGTYSVTVTDTLTGCSNSDSTSIAVNARPVAFAGVDVTVNDAAAATQLLGSGGTLFSWLPTTGLSNATIATPLASPAVTTTYTLTVSDLNGCSDTDAVTITVLSDVSLVVANMITPNSDGFNDVWNVIGIDQHPDNTVTVYNRNGIQVFAADNYDNTWGGTYNGDLLPDGTYYYVIKLTDSDKEIKGALTILHAKK